MQDQRYQVVVNHEEQYSIWTAEQDPPAGWRPDGTVGTEQECLDHIDRVWTDLRPLSARPGPSDPRPGPSDVRPGPSDAR